MNRRAKVILVGIGVVALAASFAVPLSVWAQGTTGNTPAPIYTQVIIPGSPVETTVDGFVRGRVTDIAQYIGLIYNFLISIIGVVAGVMIMVGGFQYLTAGGDKSKVDEGKKRIYNALAGIVIAFTAYLLLNTINPDLVNLKTPQVANIVAEKVPFGGYQPVVAPSHLCSQDSDCTSLGKGYKCFHNLTSGPGKTADGQCALEQQNAPKNVSCTADSQCASQKCLKSDPSKDAGYCSTGSEGDICFKDGDCTALRRCVSGGGGLSYCSQGLKDSYCSSSSDCITADLVCKSVGGISRCTSADGAAEGDPCVQNVDCKNSNGSTNNATADNPVLWCLKPPSDANPSCKVGGDYETKGTECFCHAVAPEEAKGVDLYCFKDTDCYQGSKPPQLHCKLESGKAYGQCAQ